MSDPFSTDLNLSEWQVDKLIAEINQLRREQDVLKAALKEEMLWDMGGVIENEYKARARRYEKALRKIVDTPVEHANDWTRELQKIARAALAKQ